MDPAKFQELLNQYGQLQIKNPGWLIRSKPDSIPSEEHYRWVSFTKQTPCPQCGQASTMIYKVVNLPRGRKLEKKCALCKQYLGRLDRFD